MTGFTSTENQIQNVSSFYELVQTPYRGNINAICWNRELKGNFLEIIEKIAIDDAITVVEEEDLLQMTLSEQGRIAREIILSDLKDLHAIGASPVLNLIRNYDRDENHPFFPTDVYSFHVDSAPIPTHTFLCTYHGASSEILPNAGAIQKVLLPEILTELKKLYNGTLEGFENYLKENFFDLHFQALPDAEIISLGNGHLWRLATEHPGRVVPPCIHRAPNENPGEFRLLLIC